MRNDPISLELSKDEFIHIYKACLDRKEKLESIESTSDDEDVIADAGNDLIEINIILKELKRTADSQWGVNGWTTSDEYL